MSRAHWASVGAAAALVFGTATPLHAAAPALASASLDAEVNFDIPAQPLESALLVYSRQAHIEVMSASSTVHGKMAPTIRGRITPRIALEQLLKGSRLSFISPAGNTVAIRPVAERSQSRQRAAMAEPAPPRAQAAPTAAFDAAAPGRYLEEIVVTATRWADTLNHVPLAITAQTYGALDQRGVRTVRDLEGFVPSLLTTQVLASGASQFAIRGIGLLGSSPAGAATVGFYLDDTPLQKRNVGGGTGTSNGTPLPPLFDLERVEVLRGPQGTLFGGGSEGGTIRYIQVQPSLTRYSTYGRLQLSQAQDADSTYETGLAVGGPLVPDKLGFRASMFARNQGGFIDLIDPLTGKEWVHNSGGEAKVRMVRGALTWVPRPGSRVTLDFFSSVDKSKDISTSSTLPAPNPIVVPTACFNANNTPIAQIGFVSTPQGAIGVNTAPRGGPIASLSTTPAPRYRNNPFPVARGDAACAERQVVGDVTFTVPGYSYGPFNTDRWDAVSVNQTPSKTNLQVASLALEQEGQGFNVKSITSYIDDQTKSVTGLVAFGFPSGLAYVDPEAGLRVSLQTGPGYGPMYGSTAAEVTGHIPADNRRYGLTQELRFASSDNGSRLAWVAGGYYANIRGKSQYHVYQDSNFFSRNLIGIDEVVRYGAVSLASGPGLYNVLSSRSQRLKDLEIAIFAEANYWVVRDKLRVTAGLRVSRVRFEYEQSFVGPLSNVYPGNGVSATGVSFASPSPQNGGYNAGATTESPLTPKVGLQYQLARERMLYLTAAKGFRTGGVNSQISYGLCGQALDQIGYLPTDLPETYRSDSVWSYELGGKFRLLNNRLQLNAAAYRIDWKDPQYTATPGSCSLVLTFNVPKARSEGVEVEAQVRLFRGLTASVAYAYTSGRYTEDLTYPAGQRAAGGPVPVPFTVVLKDQKIPTPPHTLSVGVRYEHTLGQRLLGYVRADFRFASGYAVAPFPTLAYSPDAYNQQIETTNFRAGLQIGGLDVSLFVINAFNRSKGVSGGGRSQCLAAENGGTAACTTFSAFNPLRTINTGIPREIGVQLAFRR